jgi:hypothetical protein
MNKWPLLSVVSRKLEFSLLLAALALVFQLFPAAWFGLLHLIDIRTWPRVIWMGFSIAGLAVLVGVRLVPSVFADWQKRRTEMIAARDRREAQYAAKKRRESLEQLRRSRSRRLY